MSTANEPKPDETLGAIPMRWCRGQCKRQLPLNHFPRKASLIDGRRYECRDCTRKKRFNDKFKKELGERDAFFEEMSKRLLGATDDAPVTSEWCAMVLAAFGGAEEAAAQYAAYVWRLIQDLKANKGATLGVQFQAFTKLIAASTEQRANATEMETWTPEEGEKRMKQLLRQEVVENRALLLELNALAGIRVYDEGDDDEELLDAG